MHRVTALKEAAIDLNFITFDYRTHTEVARLEAVDHDVAAPTRSFHSLAAQYQGRVLFWTNRGFHGLTSPGIETCGNAVVLLDELSFPMMVRKDNSGAAQIVGCAVVRGVDMQSRDVAKAKLPAGFTPQDKTVFKFV